MKIGIIYYNKGKYNGGAERRYYNLINQLSFKYTLFLCVNRSIELYWKELGGFNENVKIYCIENKLQKNPSSYQTSNKTIKSKRNIFIRRLISQIIWFIKYNYKTYFWAKKNKLKIINAVQAAGILSIGPKIFGAKIIFSYTDYMVENGYPFKYIFNHGLKTVMRIANKYDFLSEMIPNRMIEKGLKLNKRKINLANTSFIDDINFNPAPFKKNKIIFSGRLEAIKNPFLAIEIAEKLRAKNCDFELKILGDGPLKQVLQEIIDKKQLNGYVQIKYLNNIHDELNDALIYLSLQKENNFPSQALIEAMFSGCIPIVTNVGESKLMIKNEFGYLVNPDAIEISNIIINVLENRSKFIDWGYKSRNYARSQFSISNYLNYFNTLLKF
ncbi:MAG: glycosyltransferase [Bacteroidales bacterium]